MRNFGISAHPESLRNPGIPVAQTSGYPIGDISSAYSIMSNFNIIGMVGPTYSREAHIIAQYADSIDIPAIRYSATDPELSDRNAYPAF
ncbi:unnamed protein product [Rotaria sp. Silwood1]|nr:unnamed protein product [Rotaria sp. Silwood1]